MQSPPGPSVELDCFRLADFPDPDFLFLKTCMSEYYGRCFARQLGHIHPQIAYIAFYCARNAVAAEEPQVPLRIDPAAS